MANVHPSNLLRINLQWQMSKESMLQLKEKLLEMQKGMEFLSVKERDYEAGGIPCSIAVNDYGLKTISLLIHLICIKGSL